MGAWPDLWVNTPPAQAHQGLISGSAAIFLIFKKMGFGKVL